MCVCVEGLPSLPTYGPLVGSSGNRNTSDTTVEFSAVAANEKEN